MIVVKIISECCDDRFVKIEEGRKIVGSDLDCDIVLIDEPVNFRHFAIDVDETRIAVEPLDGSMLDFCKDGESAEVLVPGNTTVWTDEDELVLGNLRFFVQGAPIQYVEPEPEIVEPSFDFGAWIANQPIVRKLLEHPFVRKILQAQVIRIVLQMNAAIKKYSAQSVTGALVVIGAATVMIGLGLWFSSGKASASPSKDDIIALAAAQRAPAPIPVQTDEDVMRDLSNFDAQPFDVKKVNGVWTAVFYMENMVAEQELKRQLSSLTYEIQPKIYLDSRLLSGTNITLQSMSTKAKVASLQGGVVTLEGVSETDPEFTTVRSTLLADVPGLREIIPATVATQDTADLSKKIVGLWAGDHPYVALEDGTIVKTGTEIEDGVTLVSVELNSIEINIGEELVTVEIMQ